MKRAIRYILSTIIVILSVFTVGCESSETKNTAYMNEFIGFENGVEFMVTRHIYKSTIEVGYYTYQTEDTFLCLEIKVKNGSDSGYHGNSTDIWLLHGKTKIYQVDIVRKWTDGFYNISQPATTTKTYIACFELSADIPFEDLILVIDNGKWLNSEQVKILMKSR